MSPRTIAEGEPRSRMLPNDARAEHNPRVEDVAAERDGSDDTQVGEAAFPGRLAINTIGR